MAIEVGAVASTLTAHEQVDFADLLMDVERAFEDKTVFVILYAMATTFAKQYEDQPRQKLVDVLSDLSRATLSVYDNYR